MPYRNGDRVQMRTMDDDGLAIVRYGTVGADQSASEPVAVIFDDARGGDTIDAAHLEPVSLDSVALWVSGLDVQRDPDLRRGLAAMWRAEAESAGLSIPAMFPLGSTDHPGIGDGADSWLLAEFGTLSGTWVVRSTVDPGSPDTVVIRADRSNRQDGFTAG